MDKTFIEKRKASKREFERSSEEGTGSIFKSGMQSESSEISKSCSGDQSTGPGNSHQTTGKSKFCCLNSKSSVCVRH